MNYFFEQKKMTKINKIKFAKKQNISVNAENTNAYLKLRENILTLYKKNIAQNSLINYCITIDNKDTENEYA